MLIGTLVAAVTNAAIPEGCAAFDATTKTLTLDLSSQPAGRYSASFADLAGYASDGLIETVIFRGRSDTTWAWNFSNSSCYSYFDPHILALGATLRVESGVVDVVKMMYHHAAILRGRPDLQIVVGENGVLAFDWFDSTTSVALAAGGKGGNSTTPCDGSTTLCGGLLRNLASHTTCALTNDTRRVAEENQLWWTGALKVAAHAKPSVIASDYFMPYTSSSVGAYNSWSVITGTGDNALKFAQFYKCFDNVLDIAEGGVLRLEASLSDHLAADGARTRRDFAKTGKGALVLTRPSDYHGTIDFQEGALVLEAGATVAGMRITLGTDAKIVLQDKALLEGATIQCKNGAAVNVEVVADATAYVEGLTATTVKKSGAGTLAAATVPATGASTLEVNAGTLKLGAKKTISQKAVVWVDFGKTDGITKSGDLIKSFPNRGSLGGRFENLGTLKAKFASWTGGFYYGKGEGVEKAGYSLDGYSFNPSAPNACLTFYCVCRMPYSSYVNDWAGVIGFYPSRASLAGKSAWEAQPIVVDTVDATQRGYNNFLRFNMPGDGYEIKSKYISAPSQDIYGYEKPAVISASLRLGTVPSLSCEMGEDNGTWRSLYNSAGANAIGNRYAVPAGYTYGTMSIGSAVKTNGDGDKAFVGSISEVLVFHERLTPEEDEEIRAYLRDRWITKAKTLPVPAIVSGAEVEDSAAADGGALVFDGVDTKYVWDGTARSCDTLTVAADTQVKIVPMIELDRRVGEYTLLTYSDANIAGKFVLDEAYSMRWSVVADRGSLRLVKNGGLVITVR